MTILERIAAYKQREVEAAKARFPLEYLAAKAERTSLPRGFLQRLQEARRQKKFGLIAEIKKASPSKGIIRADFEPGMLARAYAAGGAACLSVLTDQPSFQGHLDYLAVARNAADLPVLRKDFLLDPYQVAESRASGADCILLILAMIDDKSAREFSVLAASFGMDVLMEVHDEAELERAFRLGARMIGINNRDLRTFETNLGVTLQLAPKIPGDILVVAESGLSSPDDLKRLGEVDVTTFLIGESLMRQTDVTEATRALLFGQ